VLYDFRLLPDLDQRKQVNLLQISRDAQFSEIVVRLGMLKLTRNQKMDYYNHRLPHNSLAYLLFILAFTLFIVQVHANETKQSLSSSMTPIIPALADLGGNTDILSKVYPTDMDDFRLQVSMPQQTQSMNRSLPKGAEVLEPFAPIGHFESVFAPDLHKLEVGLGDTIFLYSLHASGAVRSLNEGLTWFPLAYPSARAVEVSPTNRNHILLGGISGIYTSHDAGYTWQPAATATVGIKQVAFSPTYAVDGQMFAMTSGSSQTPSQLFRSHDGGDIWENIPVSGFPQQFELSPDYNTLQTIAIATGTSGILYSDNAGASWQNRNTGLDLQLGNDVYEIIFSPNYATDNTIFARTLYGLYRTVNNGTNWSLFLPYVIEDIELHPHYAANHTFFMIARVESNGQQFNALFRTQNNGESFEGLLAFVRDFELSPDYATNHTMYAQLDIGLVQSRDNGQTWYLRSDIAPKASTQELLTSPSLSIDNTMFMIRHGYTHGNAFYTVWKSTTLGFTWDKLSLPQEDIFHPIRIALSSDYGNDQTIILLIGENVSAKLYKSTDGGASWTLLNDNLPIDAKRDPDLKLSPNYTQDNTIFISGYLEGLYRSGNDGQSWQQLYTDAAITSIAIAPEYPSDPRLFISRYNNGIARSDDAGSTWGPPAPPGSGLSFLMNLSPNFSQDNTMFAVNGGTTSGGIWKSVDAGDTWIEVTDYPQQSQKASAISSNYTNDQTVAVHVDYRGVYLTEDAGGTWFALEGALPGDNPASIALPYWRGRLLPMVTMNDNFYIYMWPSQISAGFSCQKLVLNSPELQNATIAIGINSPFPARWHMNVDSIGWLSIVEPDGTIPDLPQLLVDSDQITEPVRDTVEVNVYLSYQQSVSFDVPVFLPCYGVNLPIIVQN
jgi:photosystem II stability/assembly factor-like uncharacterized protein